MFVRCLQLLNSKNFLDARREIVIANGLFKMKNNVFVEDLPNINEHYAIPELGGGHKEVCIAILDGPFDVSHSCFNGANLRRIDPMHLGMPTDPTNAMHGTHVASVIFGQVGSEVLGIAPECQGLLVPVFHASQNGRLSCSQLELTRGIAFAAANGANVINISGGQSSTSGRADPALSKIIKECSDNNILIVAAVGNDGCNCLNVPAAEDNVLAVGAMDNLGRPLESSNWGGAYHSHGILALGLDILGALPVQGTIKKTGSSFATPIVSGIVALLAGRQRELNRMFNLLKVRDAILGTAQPCETDDVSHQSRCLMGKLDAVGAHRRIMSSYLEEDSVNKQETVFLAEVENGMTSIDSSGTPLDKNKPDDVSPSVSESSRVVLAECSCGGTKNTTTSDDALQLVFALGKFGFDVGSEARRDSLMQAMPANKNNPLNAADLLSYLDASPFEASSVIWTLNLDVTPIYAIQPAGPFAAECYSRIREFYAQQLSEGVELISVPGVILGSVKLQFGQVVPRLVPALRGMYSWAKEPLIQHLLGPRPQAASDIETYDRHEKGLTDFLDRIYYDLRNLGITPEERAINFSATNAFQIAEVIKSATVEELDLDSIIVKKSAICRPESECFDVEVVFFNPNNTNTANRVFRFTVDVSDVVPVTIGHVRGWTRRSGR
jgi:hypothetical protein